MDSFELQMQLTGLLMGLNSSKQASFEICNFLIRNYVTQEDLYPALLDVLPKLDINKRLNFFQFIDDFLTLVTTEPKYKDNDIIFNYAFLIISDLHKILQYVLPETPSNVTDSSIAGAEAGVPKRSDIRTLANLPFCYSMLVHISKLFNLQVLAQFQKKYNSNLLTETDIDNVKRGLYFDEKSMYMENVEPTKSSHVDDYVNSSPKATDDSHQQQLEDNYIPEKINQGLIAAWDFIIKKRKQSEYEFLLIDYLDDPFHIKPMESTSKIPNSGANINNTSSPTIFNTSVKNTEDGATAKTPAKTPGKTPAKTPGNVSSQTPSNSNILSLTQSLTLQRIEADRERQKRGKETLWEVERPSGTIKLAEFEYIYDTLQPYDEVGDKPIIDEMENLYELCTFREAGITKAANKSHPPPTKQKPSNRSSSTKAKSRGKTAYDSQDLFYSNHKTKRPRTHPNMSSKNTYIPNSNSNEYMDSRLYDGYYDYDSEWYYKNGRQSNSKRGGYGYERKR